MTDLESLPSAYGKSMLTALAQGPEVIYVYWEISPPLWRLFTGARPVLCLYEVDKKTTTVREEVPLERAAGNYYFRRLSPGRVYRGALGLREDTAFYTYLFSRRVATPPVEATAETDRRVMVPPPFRVFEGVDLPGSSEYAAGGKNSCEN